MTSRSPCVASASVRDMITKAGSRRASAAARIFCAASSAEITSLPFMWPQRFGQERQVAAADQRPAHPQILLVAHHAEVGPTQARLADARSGHEGGREAG